MANSSQHDLMSPEPRRPQSLVLEQLPHLLGRLGQGSPSPPSPVSSLLPDLEEIRVSPCIAKKGHLNVLEEKSKGWKKRWVVVRRPYVFIFRDERYDESTGVPMLNLLHRDPCERALINLATARTEYSPGEAAAGVSHSFSIVTYQRGYLIQVNCCIFSSNSNIMVSPTQAASDRDLHDWLYAINPLLAGQIKSKVRHLNAC